MAKILLLSHGNLAKEMYETLRLIIGNVDDFSYLSYPEDDDMTEYVNQIAKFLDSHQEVLVVTDLLGGSPLITLAKTYRDHSENYKNRVQIIAGMNLSLLLEAGISNKYMSLDLLAESAINAGKIGIVNFLDKIQKGVEANESSTK